MAPNPEPTIYVVLGAEYVLADVQRQGAVDTALLVRVEDVDGDHQRVRFVAVAELGRYAK